MSFSRFALAGLLLSVANAVSVSPVSSQAQVQPSATCRTILGDESLSSVPTITKTRRVHDPTPVVVFTTVQDTVTYTPSLSTILATDYETATITSTATPATDVFSTTSTEFEYTTSWVTPSDVTATLWSTSSITQTSTATIASSPGFTPIVDTLPTATVAKRSLAEDQEECVPWLDDYQYPKEVICHEKYIIKTTTVSTVTETPITATAAAPSTTVTVTSTITSNTVVVPSDVSTTLSFSTTSYITVVTDAPAVTDTVTSTATEIVAISTTSSYAACATNNIASSPLSSDYGSFAGQYINAVAFTKVPGMRISVGDTSSQTACCESCQQSSDCAFSYYAGISSSLRYCYLVHTTTCSVADTYSTAWIEHTVSSLSISNGNCGHYVGSQH
ncbi:hypothetical protein N7495_008677 [Penicillium taxi]|uniref:uncharacterized protein n=1 Tax=Penicillium taxi TaxID=168475 RepID=UPI00254507A7|nr:uncharacterized protein N7495_008677 [Penicillium taxi]KAJ5888636.1 hypothetical protein N7495_008677 [Penicillium taxi]